MCLVMVVDVTILMMNEKTFDSILICDDKKSKLNLDKTN